MTRKQAKRISKKYIMRAEKLSSRATRSRIDILRYGDKSRYRGRAFKDLPYQNEAWMLTVKALRYAFALTGIPKEDSD